MNGNRIEPDVFELMKLIGLLRSNCSRQQLEEAFKANPRIAHNLLHFINTEAKGFFF